MRRRRNVTTAKLGRDTVAMLRDVATPSGLSLDEAIWQLAVRVARTARLNGEALRSENGIPRDRAVYRAAVNDRESGIPGAHGQ